MNERGTVLPDLQKWLGDQFAARGSFFATSNSEVIVGIPFSPASPLLTFREGTDSILVNLGLGVGLDIPIDEPFDFDELTVPVRALIETGVTISVPRVPTGAPILRYTLSYDGGILSTRVPDREYIDISVPGWTAEDTACR